MEEIIYFYQKKYMEDQWDNLRYVYMNRVVEKTLAKINT